MKYNSNLKDPSKKYIEVVEKGFSVERAVERDPDFTSAEFFKSKLNEEDFEVEELASGFILIGYVYQEIKDYESAAFYFNK